MEEEEEDCEMKKTNDNKPAENDLKKKDRKKKRNK
jgi:hypothetical protein